MANQDTGVRAGLDAARGHGGGASRFVNIDLSVGVRMCEHAYLKTNGKKIATKRPKAFG